MSKATFAVIFAIILLLTATGAAIFFARGYGIDLSTKSLLPTGILVATSDPDGASVFINGKLATATNNTLNLAPGDYEVKIQKDGFSFWTKKVTIKTEEVFKTNAFLFPTVPDLRPLTLTGAINPAISPDGTKIAYSVASASGEKNGVWLLDLARSPLPSPLGSADTRLLYRTTPALSLAGDKFLWSSDSKQILAYSLAPTATLTLSYDTPATLAASLVQTAYLLDSDRQSDAPTLLGTDLAPTLSQWADFQKTAFATQTAKLNPNLAQFLATTSSHLKFAPDETKILYQATASASLPLYLPTYLPGKNPTPEERHLAPGSWYVYDTKEDKNYLIKLTDGGNNPEKTVVSWFPSSRHLLYFDDHEIWVSEHDGTNKSIIYAGPFVPGLITSWLNWSKIVILTSLNNAAGIGENLYTINLR